MQRREFLASSFAASAAALTGATPALAQTSKGPREFYQLRQYHLRSGPQIKLTEDFLTHAFIPAVSRLGMGPVGAFRLDYGSQTPIDYVLIPGRSVEALATLDLTLAQDDAFLKAADPLWNAPATAPAFERAEYSLLSAFEGWPKLVLPPFTAAKTKHIVQLRTYESPSYRDHLRKVEMFHHGEFEVFEKCNCHPVFFSETIVGTRMPSLTYMLSFPDLAALDQGWTAFRAHPDWVKLRSNPRYAFEQIVSNVTNLILSPLSCSQI